jgi:hypothetical protein
LRKLENLNEPLLGFTGKPAVYQESEQEGPQPLTRKVALVNCLALMRAKDGREQISGRQAIRAYRLATRIYEAEDELEIEWEEDMEMLRAAVDCNTPGYVPYIQGQLLEYLGVPDSM